MLMENMFHSLIEDVDVWRIVYPHLKEEYIVENIDRILFKKIRQYETMYNKRPKWSDLKLLLESDTKISEKDTEDAFARVEEYRNVDKVGDPKLLVDEIENWAQTRALELAILESVDIIQDQKKGNKGLIEDLIKQALAVQFQVSIGHDYFKDAPARLEAYMTDEEVIPFKFTHTLNEMMNGGLRKSAMFIYCAPPNKGKTLVLCDNAAQLVAAGLNVLYISGEMAETMISKRVDANLLDIDMDNLSSKVDKRQFMTGIKDLYEKSCGRLIVKQYPAGTANIHHIRALIQEIKLKKDITIDAIVLDYLNLFASTRLPASAATNTYLYVKFVAEEFRGLCVDLNIPCITATQINRGGANAAPDAVDMTGISDSFGIAMTADWMAAIIQTPELFEQSKYLMKVIKSRFGDNINGIYTIGVERSKMRLHDLEESERAVPIHIKDQLAAQARAASEKSAMNPGLAGAVISGGKANPFDFGDGS